METSPQSIFRSGDRIKVSLTTNFDGFVYVLTVNPAGELTLLFPSSDVGTFNAVRRGVTYQIPSKLDGWFKFQGQKGQERLFVTMSPEPVPEIEQEFKSAGIVRTAQDVLPSGTGAATAPATPKDPSRTAPRVEPKTRGLSRLPQTAIRRRWSTLPPRRARNHPEPPNRLVPKRGHWTKFHLACRPSSDGSGFELYPRAKEQKRIGPM